MVLRLRRLLVRLGRVLSLCPMLRRQWTGQRARLIVSTLDQPRRVHLNQHGNQWTAPIRGRFRVAGLRRVIGIGSMLKTLRRLRGSIWISLRCALRSRIGRAVSMQVRSVRRTRMFSMQILA